MAGERESERDRAEEEKQWWIDFLVPTRVRAGDELLSETDGHVVFFFLFQVVSHRDCGLNIKNKYDLTYMF